jgi:hypothetical protein
LPLKKSPCRTNGLISKIMNARCLQLLKWQASIALTSMHRCLQSWCACLVVHSELFYDKCWLTNFCTFLQILGSSVTASLNYLSTDGHGSPQIIHKWDRRNWSVNWHLRDHCGLLEDIKWDKISIANCLNLGVWTLKQCGLALYSKPCLVGRTHTIISVKEVPLPLDFCGKGDTICVTSEMPIKHRHGHIYILNSPHDSIPNTCPIWILNLVPPTNMWSPKWELVW